MYGIEIKESFLIYLLATMACLGAAMLYDIYGRSRRQHWDLSEDRLGRCPKCGHTFIADRTHTAVLCPRCGKACRIRNR
jgi:ribosomal protein L32